MRGSLGGAVERVGAEHVVGDEIAAFGDAVDDLGRAAGRDRAGAGEGLDQAAEGRRLLRVGEGEQVADARRLDVVGRDPPGVAAVRRTQQVDQVEARARRLVGRHEVAVVDDDRRLAGDPEELVAPVRVGGSAAVGDRAVRLRAAVVDELDQLIDRRAHDQVGRRRLAAAGRRRHREEVVRAPLLVVTASSGAAATKASSSGANSATSVVPRTSSRSAAPAGRSPRSPRAPAAPPRRRRGARGRREL